MPAVVGGETAWQRASQGRRQLVRLPKGQTCAAACGEWERGPGLGVLRWLLSFEGKKGRDTQNRGELGPVATGRAWQWGESVGWDPRSTVSTFAENNSSNSFTSFSMSSLGNKDSPLCTLVFSPISPKVFALSQFVNSSCPAIPN